MRKNKLSTRSKKVERRVLLVKNLLLENRGVSNERIVFSCKSGNGLRETS